MGHLNAIPVDTHVFQIAARDYLPHLRSCKSLTKKVYSEIADHFRAVFGEYAGWAHSVSFKNLFELHSITVSNSPLCDGLEIMHKNLPEGVVKNCELVYLLFFIYSHQTNMQYNYCQVFIMFTFLHMISVYPLHAFQFSN